MRKLNASSGLANIVLIASCALIVACVLYTPVWNQYQASEERITEALPKFVSETCRVSDVRENVDFSQKMTYKVEFIAIKFWPEQLFCNDDTLIRSILSSFQQCPRWIELAQDQSLALIGNQRESNLLIIRQDYPDGCEFPDRPDVGFTEWQTVDAPLTDFDRDMVESSTR